MPPSVDWFSDDSDHSNDSAVDSSSDIGVDTDCPNLLGGRRPLHHMPRLLDWMIALTIPICMVFLNLSMVVGGRAIDQLERSIIQPGFSGLNLLRVTTMRALVSGALAAASAALVTLLHPLSKGSGLPELKGYLNGNDMPGLFVGPGIFVRALGAVLATSAGICVGREGPLVVAGGGVGVLVTQLLSGVCFKSWVRRTTLISTGQARQVHDLAKHSFGRAKRCGCIMGGAAGIAAAFNAPIGGVLYMLEETTVEHWPKELTFKTFVATTMAVLGALLTAAALHACGVARLPCLQPVFTGRGTRLCLDLSGSKVDTLVVDRSQHPFTSKHFDFSWQQLPVIMVLGVAAGFLSAAYTQGMVQVWKLRERAHCCAWRRGLHGSHIVEAALYAVVTAVVLVLLPLVAARCAEVPEHLAEDARMQEVDIYAHYLCEEGSYNELAALLLPVGWEEALKNLYSECTTAQCRESIVDTEVASLPWALLTYYIFTVGTAGLGMPMGTFVPNMFLGALLGRWFRQALDWYGFTERWDLQLAHPGVYAFLGSAGMLAGFTRMSVAIVVILVELSNNISLSLGLMVSICIARRVSKTLVYHDFCDQLVVLKKVPFLRAECPAALKLEPVGNHCGRVPPEVVLKVEASAGAVRDALDACPGLRFLPIRDAETSRILGLVPRPRLEKVAHMASQEMQPNSSRVVSWLGEDPTASVLHELSTGSLKEGLVELARFVEPGLHSVSEKASLASVYPLFVHASPVQAIGVESTEGWLGVLDREHLVGITREHE